MPEPSRVPTEKSAADEESAPQPQLPQTEKTFRDIFAPAQEGFDQTGMTDEELSDFIEAEVKAYQAESCS